MSTLLVEAARTRSTEDQVKYDCCLLFGFNDMLLCCRAILAEHGVSSDFCNLLGALYSEQRDNLINHIDTTG